MVSNIDGIFSITKGVINVQNKDKYCFIHAISAAFNCYKISSHGDRSAQYRKNILINIVGIV